MFSFTKNRFSFYIMGGALFLFSAVSPLLFSTNYGIDLTGGIQIEYKALSDIDHAEASAKTTAEALQKSVQVEGANVINDILIYSIAGTNHFVVEAGFSNKYLTEEVENAKKQFVDELAVAIREEATQVKYVNIGASFGDYIKKSGMYSLFWAVVFITLYITYAFRGSIEGMASWPFALVTGISLVFDVTVSFGLYMLASAIFPEFKIDTFFLTALLTILGYSINDTIVVMDRIRSNLKKNKKGDLAQTIDNAIHATLRRSILTSSTVFLVVLAMFIFGPVSLKGFMLALLFGTIIGTYSSIFIASPLILDITNHKK